jgi:hypothetical protein
MSRHGADDRPQKMSSGQIKALEIEGSDVARNRAEASVVRKLFASTPKRLTLSAKRLKAQILAEERHYVILEAICYRTCVRTVVHLKAVYDSIVI